MRQRSRAPRGARSSLLFRHPWRVLAVALVFLLVLAAIGRGVEKKLSPTSLDVPGTPSSHGDQMLRQHFGNSAPFAILLRGPAAAIDRQGPALVHFLRRNPKVTTLSPWDRGSVQRLRPNPRHALILVDFHVGLTEAVNKTVPELNQDLEQRVHPPVRATESGFATLSKAIQTESIDSARRGEEIALPILVIVLLLVFRSPVAAAIPLAFGAVTVIGSRGLLSIGTHWFSVDAFALSVTTMMGLALGVDYSLLMVSRFREEVAGGATPLEAARTTRRTAGRTVAFAGSTLVVSMIVAMFIVPGSLLASLAGSLAMVVVLSVAVAVIPAPAVLILVGAHLDRWRIGGAATVDGRSSVMTFVSAALRRPAPVATAIGLVVLILAVPALALKTGPPSQEQLSHTDPARLQFEEIDKAIGPGWDAPFEIIAAARRGTMTDPSRLAALTHWQQKIASMPGVQAVIGPGQVAHAVAPLRKVGSTLIGPEAKNGPLGELSRLGRGLNRAAGGVTQLREGISRATYGAGLLAAGSGRAEEGATEIASGLSGAIAGSARAVHVLGIFAEGTRTLAGAQQKAALGSQFIFTGLRDLFMNARRVGLPKGQKAVEAIKKEAEGKVPSLEAPAKDAEERLKGALKQIEGMTVGKGDSNYEAALSEVRRALAAVSGTDPATGQPYASEYAGLPTELAALKSRLATDSELSQEAIFWLETVSVTEGPRLSAKAKELWEGLIRIEKGGKKLAHGSARISQAASRLGDGLTRLGSGADALAGGLARLAAGTSTLEQKLAEGFRVSYPLQKGLRRATVQVLSNDAKLKHETGRLQHSSPGLFNSGYFVLSALDGATPLLRERAANAIDLNSGGQAAKMLIISKYPFNSPGSRAVNKRLEGDAVGLGREAGVATGIAGGAAQLNDYSKVTRERIPWVIIAITFVTFLVLVLILRAIPLAAIAVALNLASVAVAFGVLTLLFNVPANLPLGGHTYVDAVGAVMLFGVIFGLSIDYAVFLLVRMRERYEGEDEHSDAIEFGLEKTARVITGAAAIMMAVFIAFAGASIATVSQLGAGLTVAVLLDATVVRIVLLPALMLLLGERVWWLPRSMARVLPRFRV